MGSNYNTPTLSVIIVATDLFGPHHYEGKIIYLVMSFFFYSVSNNLQLFFQYYT